MNQGRTKKRRTYHRGGVREDMLAEANRLLDEQSAEAITVRSLTAAIGVTPGNFYNHFENLDELLAVLAAQTMRELTASVHGNTNPRRRPKNTIMAAVRDYVRFACKKPHRYRLLFGSAVWKLRTNPIFLDAAEDAFEALVKMLYGDDRYDRNDLPGSHVRCLHAYALFSLMNGLAHNVIDGLVSLGTPKEIDDFTDAVTASFLLGVAHEELAERLA